MRGQSPLQLPRALPIQLLACLLVLLLSASLINLALDPDSDAAVFLIPHPATGAPVHVVVETYTLRAIPPSADRPVVRCDMTPFPAPRLTPDEREALKAAVNAELRRLQRPTLINPRRGRTQHALAEAPGILIPILLAIATYRWWSANTRAAPPGHCPRCAYPRRKLRPGAPCPECGTPPPQARTRRTTRSASA